jgi:alpha-1,3-rhamnosyl/mannosyltransferase
VKVIFSVEAVRYPLTGIGRYTYELAHSLNSIADIQQLQLFTGTRFIEELPQAADTGDGMHSLRRWVQKSSFAIELYRILNPMMRWHRLRPHSDHLYHAPNFFLPPFSGAKIATFHDLSPFKWPQCHDPAKLRYLQKELRRTLDTADALITDSEFTRNELVDFCGWNRNKIHVAPLAAGSEFRPRSESELRTFLQEYQLSYRGFSLFVGTIEPRKNIHHLLDAYLQLPKELRHRYPLVICGYPGWNSEDIHARIQSYEAEGWLRYLGFLPAHHLPLLYSAAGLFCFPSLYEGFGLPVLEAMQSGVPVICSNRASLPEVCGSAGILCDAEDSTALAESMAEVMQSDELADNCRRMGLVQAATFTWQACAQQTARAYQSLM